MRVATSETHEVRAATLRPLRVRYPKFPGPPYVGRVALSVSELPARSVFSPCLRKAPLNEIRRSVDKCMRLCLLTCDYAAPGGTEQQLSDGDLESY